MENVFYLKNSFFRLFFLITFILNILVCLCIENRYRASGSGGSDSPTNDVHVSSKIQCAASCARSETCTSFSYNKDDRRCFHSSGLLSASITGHDVYSSNTQETPTSPEIITEPTTVSGAGITLPPGYQVYSVQGMSLCLKVSTLSKNRAAARMDCESSDTHLVLIENGTMYDAVVQVITTELGSASGVWIDGEDVDGSNRLVSYKNEDIPYVRWNFGNPYDHLDCIVILPSNGRMGSRTCSYSNPYICQCD